MRHALPGNEVRVHFPGSLSTLESHHRLRSGPSLRASRKSKDSTPQTFLQESWLGAHEARCRAMAAFGERLSQSWQMPNEVPFVMLGSYAIRRGLPNPPASRANYLAVTNCGAKTSTHSRCSVVSGTGRPRASLSWSNATPGGKPDETSRQAATNPDRPIP